jgi:NAD/NADP transhydrogenase beta subunit
VKNGGVPSISTAGLSSQKTARLGNVLGMSGVALGITTTIGEMDNSIVPQFVGCMGIGGAAGYAIASKVGPTELPQTVAAFHSLVGIAAAATAVGDYAAHLGDPTSVHHAWDAARAVRASSRATPRLAARFRCVVAAPRRALSFVPATHSLGSVLGGGCAALCSLVPFQPWK